MKKLILFSIILSFVSCKKDPIIPNPQQPSYPKIIEKMWVNPANPSDTGRMTFEYDHLDRIIKTVDYQINGTTVTTMYSFFQDSITLVTRFQNPQIQDIYRFGKYLLDNYGNVVNYTYNNQSSNVLKTITNYIWNGTVIDSVKLDYYNTSGNLINSVQVPFFQKPISASYKADTIPSYMKKIPNILPLSGDPLDIFGETFDSYNVHLPEELVFSNPDYSNNLKYSYKWSGNKITEIFIESNGINNGQAFQGSSKVILVYK
jgi:hypothetical protein